MAGLTIKSTFQLNTGFGMPVLAFGTAGSKVGVEAVTTALRYLYLHIDTAQIYGSEKDTGIAIRNSVIPRSSVFICSKLWDADYTRDGALQGVKRSLRDLQVEYIDLFLLHNPRGGANRRKEAWLGLQNALDAGLVRSIGVSNWSAQHLDQLMEEDGVEILPACNQIEYHPWNQQRALVEHCKGKGVQVTAYSALAQGLRLDDAVISAVADKYNKTPSQVILRWILQRGVVPITKSSREDRIQQSTQIFGWSLEPEDCEKIDQLDEGMNARIGDWNPDDYE